VIASAEEVYVFPYTSSANPKPDLRHLRALDPPARDTLKRLPGDSRNWFQGFLDIAEPLGVRSIGVLFRTRSDELILFFDTQTISGCLRGHAYYGGLEDKPREALEKWKNQYAGPELQRQ
jgi:hypothetical protein